MQLVIFDLDGTLYRTHETLMPAFREMCERYGIPLTGESENFLMYTTTQSFLQKNAPDMTAEQRAEFGKEIKRREVAAVKERGRLFDGVREMLDSLRNDGVEMVICSMGTKDYIETVLDRCGIARHFRKVYHRVEGLTKSQVMKTLLVEMKPDQIIMAGDSITDITAARENGVPFIGVTYGYGAEDIQDSDALVHDVKNLQAEIYRFLIYSRIEREIFALPKPCVIGINGIDTSGKTMFSDNLCKYLQRRGITAQVLHGDDFHNSLAVRRTDDSPEGYLKHAFDIPRLEGVIRKLKAGEQTTVDLLDLDSDTYSEKVFEPTDVIIVEKVLLYREPLKALFDYRIFIDITFEEVLVRAMARDVPRYGEDYLLRYKQRYIPAQKLYIDRYDPKGCSQLVIDNNDVQRPVISYFEGS
ncbi:MAG: HAD hydrolase-like protein [Oscillospiraceae bacterium]|nr:HAD hydrolase-like protein [Oscillospiraceae bacterium]